MLTALGTRRVVLVLDNFEHVAEAASDVGSLLRSAAASKVLATSRAPLRLAAEREYPVPPLEPVEARQLFAGRAAAVGVTVRADDPLVAEVSESLDRLPLAIELAAARTRLFSLAELRDRLEQRLELLATGARDVPERHRTLRATLDWSYRLLAEREPRLLARLAVFAGGCSFSSAEVVCGADVESLSTLVDNSLVHKVDSRLGMLETVRQYALERLAESGEEEAVRQAHASFLLALAESARSNVHDLRALSVLDVDNENFRAAIAFAKDAGLAELHLRLCTALWSFWYTRGFLSEARSHFESSVAPGAVPQALRAAGLRAAAVIAWAQGDLAAAASFVDDSRDLYRELGDRDGLVAGTDHVWTGRAGPRRSGRRGALSRGVA